MKFIYKSSCLLFFVLIFLNTKAQNTIPAFFNQTDSTYLYHTLLDAYSFHFSGIMAIKKINQQYRIIFSTETGSTLFDFTVDNKHSKVNYIMKEMKNPIFVSLIKIDLIDLVKIKVASDKLEIQKNRLTEIQDYIAHKSYQPIEYVIQFNKHQKAYKSIVYHITDSQSNSNPDEIKIHHLNMPIQIEMDIFYNVSD